MRIDKTNIESYLPHRAPFIMVDRLIHSDNKTFETDFMVLPKNIFLEGVVLREYALIENIAQSAAVGLHLLLAEENNKMLDGYLGAISKLELYALPEVNDTILTKVTLLNRFGNMFLVKGINYLNGIKLLECELKLVGL